MESFVLPDELLVNAFCNGTQVAGKLDATSTVQTPLGKAFVQLIRPVRSSERILKSEARREFPWTSAIKASAEPLINRLIKQRQQLLNDIRL
jgi:hypothetical protein